MLSRNQLMLRNTQNGSRLGTVASASFMTKSGIGASQMKMSLLQRGLAGTNIGNYNQVSGDYLSVRHFSYPDHIKVEMPNLSPTMEKVSIDALQFRIVAHYSSIMKNNSALLIDSIFPTILG
jgi:hypothetical protein